MADKFRAKVYMTPIVTLDGDPDGDSKDVIHHDIKRSLGGSLEYDTSEIHGTARWFYTAATTFNSSPSDAISGTYTDGTAVASGDNIRMAYIEHLGLDSAGNKSSSGDRMYISLDGGSASTDDSALMLNPNESIVFKFKTQDATSDMLVSRLHLDAGSTSCQMKIIAICDDVA